MAFLGLSLEVFSGFSQQANIEYVLMPCLGLGLGIKKWVRQFQPPRRTVCPAAEEQSCKYTRECQSRSLTRVLCQVRGQRGWPCLEVVREASQRRWQALVLEGCKHLACLRSLRSSVAYVEGVCWEVKAQIWWVELRKTTWRNLGFILLANGYV